MLQRFGGRLPATTPAQRATTTIPIVLVGGNPVAQGFAASLSRPGRKLTGVAIITGDLNPKRIRLLQEAGLARLAVPEGHSARGLGPLSGIWQGPAEGTGSSPRAEALPANADYPRCAAPRAITAKTTGSHGEDRSTMKSGFVSVAVDLCPARS